MKERKLTSNFHWRTDSDRRLLRELQQLTSLIRAGQPKKPSKWYEFVYEKVSFFTKYIGIPGLIIAAVGPVQKLGQDWIEHHNRKFIQSTYIDYATVLLNQGAIDRANRLLSTLESQKDFDSRLQYYKAKILIAIAIQQGKNYDEAYDTARILTNIQDNKDLLFPSMGAVDELLELKMALIDIDTAQQRYKEAKNDLQIIEKNRADYPSALLKANIDYRYGVLAVLQFNLDSAVAHLSLARAEATATKQNLLAVNAAFQLAKAHQFKGEHTQALELYQTTEQEYGKLADQFGLLRTYNNIAMIYFDRMEDEKARKYYNMEQVLARRVGDELGYARATMNIALIEKRQGNYDSSIRMALEALGAFKQQSTLNGIHGAAILLANDYFLLNKLPEALVYAQQAYTSALQQRDLRAVFGACGTLADIYNRIGNKQEALFSALCTMVVIKHLDYQKLPKNDGDYNRNKSTIERVKAGVSRDVYENMLLSAEKRLGDVLVELNLEKNIMMNEVAELE